MEKPSPPEYGSKIVLTGSKILSREYFPSINFLRRSLKVQDEWGKKYPRPVSFGQRILGQNPRWQNFVVTNLDIVSFLSPCWLRWKGLSFENSLKPFTTALEKIFWQNIPFVPSQNFTEALELCLKQHAIFVYGNRIDVQFVHCLLQNLECPLLYGR